MTDRDDAELHRQKLEALLSTSLEQVSDVLGEQDVNDVRQYIDHGEYGVGWELLWHLVNEKGLEISEEMKQSGRRMNFDISLLDKA